VKPLTRGLLHPDPRSVCPLSSAEFVEPPPPLPKKKSWVRYWLTAAGLNPVSVASILLFLLQYRRCTHILKLEAIGHFTVLSSVRRVFHIDDVLMFRYVLCFRSLLVLRLSKFMIFFSIRRVYKIFEKRLSALRATEIGKKIKVGKNK
jgi:hypothetical protein